MKKLLLIILVALSMNNCKAQGATCATADTINMNGCYGSCNITDFAQEATSPAITCIGSGIFRREGWFYFNNPVTQDVSIVGQSISSNTNVIIQLCSGICGSPLTEIGCGNNNPNDSAQYETLAIPLLPAGNYYFRILNVGNTPMNMTMVNVCVYDSLIASFTIGTSHTNETCAGSCNGTASVYVTGSTGPYAYSWLPSGLTGGTTNSVTNLCAGNYTVTVTDALSALVTQTVQVNPPYPLTVFALGDSASLCLGNSSQLQSFSGGGTAPYFFSWLPATGLSATNIDNPLASPAVTTTYTVTITDGCSVIATATVTVVIIPFASTTFNYPSLYYCTSATNPIPTITGVTTGTFAATPAGLTFVSTATGEINLSATANGTYQILYYSPVMCPDSLFQTVIVANTFISSFTYPASLFCQDSMYSIVMPTLIGGATAGTFSAPFGLLINPSNGGVDINSSSSGTYLVTNTIPAVGGCAGTSSTFTVTIAPAPTAVFTASATVGCSPLCVTFNASTCTGCSYLFDFDDGNTSTTAAPVNCYTAGVYSPSLLVTDLNGCTAVDSVFNLISVSTTCDVWPGDANSDLNVDNTDLLPIGVFYGVTGTTRAVQGNAWQNDVSANWGITESNGADIKHADCNGNGTIDANDTLAINLNFSLTHPFAPFENDERQTAPPLFITTLNSTYNASEWVDAEVWLGGSFSPADDFYGIAFNINYSASLVEPGTESITYPSSFLGTVGTNAISFTKIVPASNTTYCALTRTNHTNASGNGKIADFRFQVKYVVSATGVFDFGFTNVVANDSVGIPLSVVTQPLSVLINAGMGVGELGIKNEDLGIYPNPSNGKFRIADLGLRIKGVKITNVLGEIIYQSEITNQNLTIDLENVAKGIYFIKAETSQGIINKKLIIQ